MYVIEIDRRVRGVILTLGKTLRILDFIIVRNEDEVVASPLI
jgi:hypothetical protein